MYWINLCLFWNIFVKKFMNTFFRVTGFCFLWRVCSYIHITFSRVADNFIFIGNNFINFIAYGWNYIVNNVVCMIVAAICSRFCCISFRICRSVWSYWINWFWIRSYWIYTDLVGIWKVPVLSSTIIVVLVVPKSFPSILESFAVDCSITKILLFFA